MKTFAPSFLAAFVVAVTLAGDVRAQSCNDCGSKNCRRCANDRCHCNHGDCGNGANGNGANGNGRLGHGRRMTPKRMALSYPWHCNYYHAEWGSPVALVVPPTAEKQWNMGWGVANDRLTRIWHQFGRPYPGHYADDAGRQFSPTPRWPSDTSQFGVYYVRAPW